MLRLRFWLIPALLLLSAAAMAIDLSTKMVMVNKRPMIALRDFAETFDAIVDYDVERDEISIKLDDTTVYMVPYRMTAYINDRKVYLDYPATIIDDVTYLPLRFICDAFDLRAVWEHPDERVVIVHPRTLIRFIILLDWDWCRTSHIWRHDYDYHWYIQLHYHNHHYCGNHCSVPAPPPTWGHHSWNNQHNTNDGHYSNSSGPHSGNGPRDSSPGQPAGGIGRPDRPDQQNGTRPDRPDYQNGTRPDGHSQPADNTRPGDIRPPTADSNKPGDRPQQGGYDRPAGGYGRPGSDAQYTGPAQPAGSTRLEWNTRPQTGPIRDYGRDDRPNNGRPSDVYNRPAGTGQQTGGPAGGYQSPKDRPQTGGYAGRPGNGPQQSPPPQASKPQSNERDRQQRDEARDKGRNERDSKDQERERESRNEERDRGDKERREK